MAKSLVIVESPTKAKTISKYLGKDYVIESSAGHIKNLPESKLGIDIEKGYTPEYVTIKGKNEVIKKLVDLAGKTDRVFIATDPDREGEAIAWHIAQAVQKKNQNIHRVLFHEITKEAVKHSIENPISIDDKMVEAQQARRVMDRIVGYQVSPFLWKAIYKGLSAGRVQTVALRLIAERERAISAFNPEEFWTLTGQFKTASSATFPARLFKISGKDPVIKTEEEAKSHEKAVRAENWQIASVEKKEVKRNPGAPFITSTLQQDASSRLRFNTKKTMMVAQQLYEGIELQNGETVGLITYMRTDSVRVSEQAIQSARVYIHETYGKEYVPASPRVYKTKKSAQDAHEAIRPTSLEYEPKAIKKSLSPDQFKLYELIWNRFVSSQMESAVFDQTTVDITGGSYTFRATGRVIRFSGFLAVYGDSAEEKETESSDQDDDSVQLPKELAAGQKTDLTKLISKQNFTKPPARFTEASLVKELEANGVGRPSTYAGIVSTLVERKYAELKERKFFATDIGLSVNDILVENFKDIFSFDFTARMEENLDEIAEGKKPYLKVLDGFYHPLQNTLESLKSNVSSIKKQLVESTDVICDKCGSPMVIRWGKNGKFLACSNFPACKNAKSLDDQGTDKPEKAGPEYTGENCPTCGNPLVFRKGRFGKFISCSTYPACKYSENIQTEKKPLIPCPKCKEGQIEEKKSKRGKIFFSCNRYPACDYALWDRPVAETCPSCQNPFLLDKVTKAGTSRYCPACNYKTEVPESEDNSEGKV